MITHVCPKDHSACNMDIGLEMDKGESEVPSQEYKQVGQRRESLVDHLGKEIFPILTAKFSIDVYQRITEKIKHSSPETQKIAQEQANMVY